MSTATKIKRTAEAALDKWTRERTRALKIEVDRDLELLPLFNDFKKHTDEIKKSAQAKLDPIYKKMRELEAEIGKELLAGVDETKGTIAVGQIENAKAIAEVSVDTKRFVPAQDLLAAVPEADRGEDFWQCLGTYVTKLDKYLTEAVMTKLTKVSRSYSTRVHLKSEIKKK